MGQARVADNCAEVHGGGAVQSFAECVSYPCSVGESAVDAIVRLDLRICSGIE